MIKFTWKWNAPIPRTFTNTEAVTVAALRLLERDMKFKPVLDASRPNPTRWERIRWSVSSYFSNLWAAICGRRRYD